MKKSIILLPVLLFLMLLLSCQKNELEFSCDPLINEFVSQNKKALSLLRIDDFTSYPIDVQRAIFTSWDASKKKEIWIEKLQKVAVADSFDSAEIFHIQDLIDHIKNGYFANEDMNKDSLENVDYARYWINYATVDLGWSKKYIAFMVFRLYTNPEQLDNEFSGLTSLRTNVAVNGETGNCNCSVSSDYCGSSICASGNCTITSGCGWLFSQSCNGLCF